MNEQTILHPDQADELRRLLGTIEDWLLHASVETLDELGGFLRGLGGSVVDPEQLVTWLIHDLGEHTLTLRPDTRTSTGTGTATGSSGTESA
jgi:hypothetical protein